MFLFFIITFAFDLRLLNNFIFIYKHYINSHANTQDHICLIPMAKIQPISLDIQDQNQYVA
jgi:hypothetical protein